ncbi:hypothetical protein HK102_009238 [Quaeritorhiza haematococci]|nr:hypothetical protein HK102_009238 [Quaeritorhiza haematococci]
MSNSRGGRSGNNVRGPTSALTSFLRERGIRAPANQNPWRRNNSNPANNTAAQPAAVDASADTSNATAADTSTDPAAATGIPIPTRRNTSRSRNARSGASQPSSSPNAQATASASASSSPSSLPDSTDAPTPSGPQRQRGQNPDDFLMEVDVSELANQRATADATVTEAEGQDQSIDDPQTEGSSKKAVKKGGGKKGAAATKKRKKKEGKNSDEDESDFEVGGSSRRSNYSKRRSKKTDGDGNANDPYALGKSTTQPRPKKRKMQNMLVPDAMVMKQTPSLKDLCIKVVADCIEDVEEFGDIPDEMRTQISKIISRHRQLNNQTVKLFLGPTELVVELFDCTHHVLRLIADRCTYLTSITLGGTFLVNDAAYVTLFKSMHSQLTELKLEDAPKCKKAAIETLVRCSPNLKKLVLKRCANIADEAVQCLKGLKHLEVLELKEIGGGCVKDETLIDVLKAAGPGLKVLSLTSYPEMTDTVLTEGIAPNCTKLKELSIAYCESLTDKGVIELFTKMKSPGLTKLNLKRIVTLTDDALVSAINLHGDTLQKLNVNGLDELTAYALRAISSFTSTKLSQRPGLSVEQDVVAGSDPPSTSACPIKKIDISWIRCVDDDLFAELVTKCVNLETIKVYGCHKLTEFSLERRWFNGDGSLIRIVGNEFD